MLTRHHTGYLTTGGHWLLLTSLLFSEPVLGQARTDETSLAFDDCEVVYQDEEAASLITLCKGLADYRILRIADDLRTSLTIIDGDGRMYPLSLWTNISNRFSELSDTLTWQMADDGAITGFAGELAIQEDDQTDTYQHAPLTVLFADAHVCLQHQSLTERRCVPATTRQWGSGLLTAATVGDIACYLDIATTGDADAVFMAEFELCEVATLQTGGDVFFETIEQAVRSQDCEGRIECTASELQPVVDKLYFRERSTVFSCDIENGELGLEHTGSGVLRATVTDGPPLTISRRELVGGVTPFAGGGAAWVWFWDSDRRYVFYQGTGRWGAGGSPQSTSGLAIYSSDNELERFARCKTDAHSEIGPAWFEAKMIPVAAWEPDFLQL